MLTLLRSRASNQPPEHQAASNPQSTKLVVRSAGTGAFGRQPVSAHAPVCSPQTVTTPPTDPGPGTGAPSLNPGASAAGAAPNSRFPATLPLAPRTGASFRVPGRKSNSAGPARARPHWASLKTAAWDWLRNDVRLVTVFWTGSWDFSRHLLEGGPPARQPIEAQKQLVGGAGRARRWRRTRKTRPSVPPG